MLILKLVLNLMLKSCYWTWCWSWCWEVDAKADTDAGANESDAENLMLGPKFKLLLLSRLLALPFDSFSMRGLISWFNSDSGKMLWTRSVHLAGREQLIRCLPKSWNTRVANSLIFWLWLFLWLQAPLLFIDFKYYPSQETVAVVFQILTSGAKIQFLFHCLSDSFFQIIAICLLKSSSSRRLLNLYRHYQIELL